MNQDVLSLIESKRSAMSKGQRRIADYIETEYDKAVLENPETYWLCAK